MLSVIGFIEQENWMYASERQEEIPPSLRRPQPRCIPLAEYSKVYGAPYRHTDTDDHLSTLSPKDYYDEN